VVTKLRLTYGFVTYESPLARSLFLAGVKDTSSSGFN